MSKELIEKIRCMLDFIEKYDDLLYEAKRNGETVTRNGRTTFMQDSPMQSMT